MKEYIYLAIFSVGLIWNIITRITFEKEKEKYDKQYISLYKEYNTFLIILFIALFIDNALSIIERQM